MRETPRVAALFTTLAVAVAACGGDAADGGSDTSDAPTAATSASGPTVPDIEVEDFTGETTSVSDHVGRPLVVNFWASWCPPCIAEMPDLEAVHRSVADHLGVGAEVPS
jgi:thiol-disulfide isomerase/thioredoxin